MAGADLFREKSTAGWWLISQTNMARIHGAVGRALSTAWAGGGTCAKMSRRITKEREAASRFVDANQLRAYRRSVRRSSHLWLNPVRPRPRLSSTSICQTAGPQLPELIL
jgi:hypothetical protein